jgi:hypothetical protein
MLKARFLPLAFTATVLSCQSSSDSISTEPLVAQVVEADESDMLSDVVLEPARVTWRRTMAAGKSSIPMPSVFPHRWNGHRYWFAATPYPLGNSTLENPSAFAGDSARDWRTIPGLTNPIARPSADGYLSDPDLTYDWVHDRVNLYYRQTTASADQIYLRTSRTGSDWSEPTLVAQDTRYSLISPAIVREPDGSWRMWTVNAAAGGCRVRASAMSLAQRHSRDGITWDAPQPVNLAIAGHVPWHWDVQYVRDRHEYWALVAAYPDAGNCSVTSVFFAQSANGTTWTVAPTPLLAPGTLPALRDLVYRSTFRYYPADNAVRVWYSGARVENERFHYAMAVARYPLSELLRRVNEPSAAKSISVMRTHDPRDAQLQAARRTFVNAFP